MELQFKIKFEQTTGGPDEDGIEPPITDKTTWMSVDHPFDISLWCFDHTDTWKIFVMSKEDGHWINKQFDTAIDAKWWCGHNLSLENMAKFALKSQEFRHTFVDQKKVA
jgi:hypothetical protein|tara:strand:+ start:163 stop:489 length:327 start_codon:yes stop_codon:yes gene_type:complete